METSLQPTVGKMRQMKKSKLQATETRRRIVKAAAAEFRRNGICSTGLCELMAAAGLTHGRFCGHFSSKDQLVAEACGAGMNSSRDGRSCSLPKWRQGMVGCNRCKLSLYTSSGQSIGGCPLARLSRELVRADDGTPEAALAGFLKLVDIVARQHPGVEPEVTRARVMVVFSAMIWAVTMSRIATDCCTSTCQI